MAPPPSFDDDFARVLTGEAIWQDQILPGEWNAVSKQPAGAMKESSTVETTFGFTPTRVQAYFTGETLDRIVVIYLETGEFFGRSEVKKLKEHAAKTYKEQQQLAKQILDAQKQEERTVKEKRKVFNEKFAELKAHLQLNMEQVLGIKGKRVNVGMGKLFSRVVDFPYQDLSLRLDIEEEQLIAVTIQRKEDAGRKLLDTKTQSLAERRKDVKQNVNIMENGDVVIVNIPMLNQGERGYCAVGTLAMVAQYYGLEVNVDLLAAKAGYREGDTAQADIRPIYRAATSETKLNMRETVGFPSDQVKYYIMKGQPVVVWRAFNRERDAFHSRFAETFRQDPSKTLPDPHKNYRDKENWPTLKTGGHASLITGFNKPRKEVLFTESWGEDTRNRRMRIEEMETTTYRTFFFDP
jgi:hypothetical protein